MQHKIKQTIENYDTIIIHRHSRPDLDAIGSQVGLAESLRATYPQKHIYVVGDQNKYDFENDMQIIENDVFKGALSIIVDVAGSHMISDDRYQLAQERIIIDHHQNDTNVANVTHFWSDPSFAAAAEMIASLIKTCEFVLTKKAATYLYGGILTDTGRFLYMGKGAKRLFEMTSFLADAGIDFSFLHDRLYVEPLALKKLKAHIQSSFLLTTHQVAYCKNTKDLMKTFNVDVQTVSRGMVNQMAGIEEIVIWANFTEDKANNTILCELRARGIEIVDIAKKYGGGGHAMACGATLKTWDDVDAMIQDLDERARENK